MNLRTFSCTASLFVAASFGMGQQAHAVTVFSDDFEGTNLATAYTNVQGFLSDTENIYLVADPNDAGNTLLEIRNFNNASLNPPVATELRFLSTDTFDIEDDATVTLSYDFVSGVVPNNAADSGNIFRAGIALGGLNNRVDFAFLRNGGDTGTVRILGAAVVSGSFSSLFDVTLPGSVDPVSGEFVAAIDTSTGDITVTFGGETINSSYTAGTGDLQDDLGGTTGYSVLISQNQNAGSFLRSTVIDNLTVDVTPIPEPTSLALVGLGTILLTTRRRRTA